MADYDMGSDADASGEDDVDMMTGEGGVPLIDPALIEAALLAEALPVPAKITSQATYGQAPLAAKGSFYESGPSQPSSQAGRSQRSNGFSSQNSPISNYASYPAPAYNPLYPGYNPPPDHDNYYATLRGASPTPQSGPSQQNGQDYRSASAVAGPSTPRDHGRAGSHAPKKRGESSKPKIKPTGSHHANGKKRQKAVNGGHQRDEECSFCMGSDERNRQGQPEEMLSCDLCGRSGHPSCLEITSPQTIQRARSYPWQCIECKTCEVCKILGDDEKLMFCEGCDRGWHCYCLNPPKKQPPKGEFKCPTCTSEDAQIAQNGNKRSRSGSILPSSSVFTTGPPSSQPEPARSHKKKVRIPFDHPTSTPANKSHKKKVQPSALGLPDGFAPSPSEAVKKRKHAPSGTPAPAAGTVIKIRLPGMAGGSSSKRRLIDSPEPEEPEEPPVPFGGVLGEEDANTRPTEIKEADKEAFERSRVTAEARLGTVLMSTEHGQDQAGPSSTPSRDRQGSPALSVSSASPGPQANPFRSLRDRVLLQQSSSLPHPAPPGADHLITSTSTRPSVVGGSSTVASRISCIRFGNFDIDTWYSAPYPEEYSKVPDGRLWLCEYCLKYMKSGFVAGRHAMKCKTRHPPGDEIYRDGAVSVFEVDGRKNKIYCQNLCLLAKMFLDHKTLYYDVEPFLFYVMTETDENGAQFVGYFSKEKRSPHFNVSCIMTLPIRQRRGWGNLLIDFSYLLSKKEGRLGSPEKPLSGLGALSYRNYWTSTVMKYLSTAKPGITMEDIAKATSMTLEDIFATLSEQGMIEVHDAPPAQDRAGHARYRKNGKATPSRTSTPLAGASDDGPPLHGGLARQALSRSTVAKDAPAAALPTLYTIHWDPSVVRACVDRVKAKGLLELRPSKLKYTPFLVSRIKLGQAGTSVAAMMGIDVGAASGAASGAATAGAQLAIEPAQSGSKRGKQLESKQDQVLADSAIDQGDAEGLAPNAKTQKEQDPSASAMAVDDAIGQAEPNAEPIQSTHAVPADANGTKQDALPDQHLADQPMVEVPPLIDGQSGLLDPAAPAPSEAAAPASGKPEKDLPRFLTPPPRSMRSNGRTPSSAGTAGGANTVNGAGIGSGTNGDAAITAPAASPSRTTRSTTNTPRAGRAVRKTASRA